MFVPDSGQQTILYYNPENPHMIYVPAENQTSVSTILKIDVYKRQEERLRGEDDCDSCGCGRSLQEKCGYL